MDLEVRKRCAWDMFGMRVYTVSDISTYPEETPRTLIKCLNTSSQKAQQYKGMCSESL